MNVYIIKLMWTNINSFQAAIYYNAYMIKSIYFGYGIIELTKEQEVKLRRIYKEPLLIKLGLSRKFPRAVLFSRKSALSIRIMTPSIIIDILKAKLYVGNVTKREETSRTIVIHQEMKIVKAGREVGVGYDP